jgi:hypothetical protein
VIKLKSHLSLSKWFFSFSMSDVFLELSSKTLSNLAYISDSYLPSALTAPILACKSSRFINFSLTW